jgi:nicotinate (nicotinamide) nucleotide adenylyltransferase
MTAKPVLAVLGGSFNPPQVAHVLLPSYLLSHGWADRVVVAPCFEHALGKPLPPFARRLAWTELAMQTHGPAVDVTDIERELAKVSGRPSYTLELLEALSERHPDHRVRLVVGSDIIESGETDRWHEWEDIQRRFDPIVIPREGHGHTGAILPDVSSTQVRAWLEQDDAAAAEQLEASVPHAVLDLMRRPAPGRIWVVGHGHVATHAGRWLALRGWDVVEVSSRGLVGGDPLPEGKTDGVWLLCRDPDLEPVATALAGQLPASIPVLHGAGARRACDALAALAEAGNPVGTLHPICSLRKEQWRSQLGRASFGIAGDEAAMRLAESMVGRQSWLDLSGLDGEGRVAYHAACALAANHLAVIEDSAAGVLAGQGFSRSAADEALGVLLRSSLDNLLALGIPSGVTGPASRGDQAAIEVHVAALPDDVAKLYAELSRRLGELLA